MSSTAMSLERALKNLLPTYPGPGGACAVLRNGKVLIRHTWGWANSERRIAWTPKTLFRICSITKQFTCATVLDAFPDPSILDADVRNRLPLLEQPAPSTLDLCHNQSGLRDYWAIAMMHGASPETPFGEAEAQRVIGGTKTLQFVPGTRYSYSNQNFRLLSEIVQERKGRTFDELLRGSVFERAGMSRAMLAPYTLALPDGTEGYEGTQETGFQPAKNHIFWTGDAGIAASLDDMIAWEQHIDATRDDRDAIYQRLSVPVKFADGALAAYGFGLGHRSVFGRNATGHNGALRGWRCYRVNIPSDRLSVVVLFNHHSDAVTAATDLVAAALGIERPPRASDVALPVEPGTYFDAETGLAARLEAVPGGRVRLRYGHSPELLDINPDGTVGSDAVRLRQAEGGIWMDRRHENYRACLRSCDGTATLDVAGRFRCDELNSEVSFVDAGGVLYGGFSGFLGQGSMEMLKPVAPDIWQFPCPRALDHHPPGDWTVAFRRDQSGSVMFVGIGCWLARRLLYSRID